MRSRTQERDLQNLRVRDSINVTLPNSLWVAFDISVRRQGRTADGALIRLIDALPGLSIPDLIELNEPSKERANRTLILRIGRARKTAIERIASECGSSTSSILRRILHAFFVSREIALSSAKNGSEIQLARTQMHFKFAEDYERVGPIPLLSRQHRERS